MKKTYLENLFLGILFFLFIVQTVDGQEFKPVKNFEAVQLEINKTAETLTKIELSLLLLNRLISFSIIKRE